MTERELLLQNRFRKNIEVEKNSPKSYLYNEKKKEDIARLQRYAQMWDNLRTFRKNAVRNKNFTFGKQWEDKVRVNGRYISEEENIIRQGKAPLINNMLRQLVKTVVGAFRENKTEPQAISRDRDEQKLGEMLSIALQYTHQINSLHELDARAFESFLIKGIACQIVSYNWDKLRVRKDISSDYIERKISSEIYDTDALVWDDGIPDNGNLTYWDENTWVKTGITVRRFPTERQFFYNYQIEFTTEDTPVEDGVQGFAIYGFDIRNIQLEETPL